MRRIIRAVAVRALRPLGKTKLLGTITRVEVDEPYVALTFDDGPHPEYTPRLLSLLAEHDVRATFFMVGESAQRYPDLVASVSDAGHAIGNHTWDHPSLRRSSGAVVRAQIKRCSDSLSPYEWKMLRPPWGEMSLSARVQALWLGYEVVTWSAHAQDWIESDPDRMTATLVDSIVPGSIVLLHDAIYTSRNQNAQLDRGPLLLAVRMLLKQTKEKFQFVTLPELIERGQPVLERIGW